MGWDCDRGDKFVAPARALDGGLGGGGGGGAARLNSQTFAPASAPATIPESINHYSNREQTSDEGSALMGLPAYPKPAAAAAAAAPAIVPKPGIDKRLKPAARQQAQLQAELDAYERDVVRRRARRDGGAGPSREEAANAA